MTSICIVIPFYNEANRFNRKAFEDFYNKSDVSFIFVNDGSKDTTLALIDDIASAKNRVSVINMPVNKGKAEAVRTGVMQANDLGKYDYIGFWDADFATPLAEITEFENVLQVYTDIKIIAGSRVKRLGATIERSAFRHYFGRIFATVVTKLFQLPIYDTQCGAKLFHHTVITSLFSHQFYNKWMFDLELFIRFKKKYGMSGILKNCYEHPLHYWVDRGGSRMKVMDFISVPYQVVLLYIYYLRK